MGEQAKLKVHLQIITRHGHVGEEEASCQAKVSMWRRQLQEVGKLGRCAPHSSGEQESPALGTISASVPPPHFVQTLCLVNSNIRRKLDMHTCEKTRNMETHNPWAHIQLSKSQQIQAQPGPSLCLPLVQGHINSTIRYYPSMSTEGNHY